MTKNNNRKKPLHNSNKPKDKPKNTQKTSGLWFYGMHPIKACLFNKKRQIFEIRATQDAIKKLPEHFINKNTIDIKIFHKHDIDTMTPADSLHQGILARVAPLPYYTIDDLIADIQQDKNATVVILDQVTDPHNIGAILRTSTLFGAKAVIVSSKNAPTETAVLAKSASGALDKIPYIRANNLKRAIEQLKSAGFWICGLDGEATQDINQYTPSERTAIIMGAEGSGMRRLTKESCDTLLSIKTIGADEIIDSLNISNATAIALHTLQK